MLRKKIILISLLSLSFLFNVNAEVISENNSNDRNKSNLSEKRQRYSLVKNRQEIVRSSVNSNNNKERSIENAIIRNAKIQMNEEGFVNIRKLAKNRKAKFGTMSIMASYSLNDETLPVLDFQFFDDIDLSVEVKFIDFDDKREILTISGKLLDKDLSSATIIISKDNKIFADINDPEANLSYSVNFDAETSSQQISVADITLLPTGKCGTCTEEGDHSH